MIANVMVYYRKISNIEPFNSFTSASENTMIYRSINTVPFLISDAKWLKLKER
jgi:hypothetical protein